MTKPDDPDFNGFYAATASRVIGYLCVVLGDMAEAEDAAHEAYARAWARWPKIRTYDSPEAWVRTVALRVAMNSWRKAKNRLIAQRRSSHAERRESPDPAGLSPDRLLVIEALRKITVEQRQALVLFHMLGRTIAEISHETGVPVGTVKARLSRGRKALAPYLSEFADEDEEEDGPQDRTASPQTAPPRLINTNTTATATHAREMISGA
ncbi:MAG: sigma-70 family RNA polymerase sigma factor [Catenulispora sp.]|nr:sigma-70 family RNA polymerase sigma factor [Catenulispora sp.]